MNNSSEFNIALVTGGCKSGKSNQALGMARKVPSQPQKPNLFLATCIPADDEMHQRVKAHQETRGDGWRTLEVPMDLVGVIETHSPKASVILIDCLTLWLSNLICAEEPPPDLKVVFEQLLKTLSLSACPIILVSNEVGCGIVPENDLARRYRDIAGILNQQVARNADCVIWCVSGIPVRIK